MIKQTRKSRERILAYGGPGSGKSRAILSIASHCPDSTFYIIDNDHAYERMLEGSEFSGLKNVDHRLILERNDFESTAEQFADCLKNAGPEDWITIDLLEPTWDGVQEWFVDKIYGVDIDDYFMEVKKKRNENNAPGQVDRGFVEIDWPTIKKVYTKRIMNPIVNARCNIYFTAGIKAIDRKTDSAENIKTFGLMKGRPAGNKDIPHLFHTILMFERGDFAWTMTTAKDRERERVERAEVEDFAIDYLVEVAGWEREAKPSAVRRKSAPA